MVMGVPVAAAAGKGASLAGLGKIAGGVLSGVAKLGGVLSAFGGGKQGGDAKRLDKQMRNTVQAAQRAGLHPLFALGSGMSFSPTMQYQEGGGLREGFAELERAVGNVRAEARAKKAVDPLAVEYQRALIRQANAGASRDETLAQVALAEEARNAAAAAGTMRDSPVVTQAPIEVVPPRKDDAGTRYGPAEPAFREVTLEDGTTMLIPNQDVGFEVPEGLGYAAMAKRFSTKLMKDARAWWKHATRNRKKGRYRTGGGF